MSSSANAAWGALIKCLNTLVDLPTDRADNTPAYRAADKQYNIVEKLRPMPRAAWKRLILESKAPKALADLCIRALQQHPHSATQHLVNRSLEQLLVQCGEENGFAELGSRMSAAVIQQLQQAGLLQHLTALINSTAQDLTASGAQQHPCGGSSSNGSRHRTSGSSGGGWGQSSSHSRSSSSATDDIWSNPQKMQRSTAVWYNANDVLSIYSSLQQLMKTKNADDDAACLQPAPAALQLMMTALQIQPQEQKQLQHPLFSDVDLQAAICSHHTQLICKASTVFWRVQEAINNCDCLLDQSNTSSGQRQSAPTPADSVVDGLLCAPQLHHCLVFFCCVTTMASVSQISSSSSSGDGTGSSSSSGQRVAASSVSMQGPTVSNSRRTAAGACSLPASPISSRLCKLLGLEPDAVQFAARTLKRAGLTAFDVEDIFKLLHDLLYIGVADTRHIPFTQRLEQLESTLLLSLLLLQWADSVPSGSADTESISHAAFGVTRLALQALKAIQQGQQALLAVLPAGAAAAQPMLLPLPVAQQQLSQQQHMVPAHVPCQQQQHPAPQEPPVCVSSQQGQQLPAELPCEQQGNAVVVVPTAIVAEMLPLLLRLCRSRLQLIDSVDATQAQPATTAAQTAPGDSQTTVHRARTDLYDCMLLVGALTHACVVGLDTSASSSSSSSSSSVSTGHLSGCTSAAAVEAVEADISACGTPAAPHSFLHSQDVFVASAADILATLETFVRLAASDSDWWCSNQASSAVMMVVVGQLTAVAALLAGQEGHGPAVLQQFHSFLASLLKMAGYPVLHNPTPAARLCCEAAKRAAKLLEASLNQDRADHQQQQQQQQQAYSDARSSALVSLLPSVVIFGRYFLQIAQLLEHTAELRSSGQAASGVLQQQQQEQHQGDLDVPYLLKVLLDCAGLLQNWLQAHHTTLAAAGYPLEPVLQQLQQLQDALGVLDVPLPTSTAASTATSSSTAMQSSTHSINGVAAATSSQQDMALDSTAASTEASNLGAGQLPSHSSSGGAFGTNSPEEAMSAALQQLQQTGSALCCVAVPCLCNNPACTNTSGPTEQV